MIRQERDELRELVVKTGMSVKNVSKALATSVSSFKFTLRPVSRQITRFIVPDSKRQKLFPYVVPSQNIPKRSSDKEVPLAQKIKSIARENGADIRHRKIVESNKELGLAIENEETKFEDNNITDNNSHVMTSSTQVNLVDYRNYRPEKIDYS
ncbi:hypothetical protein EVAR_87329_1 [Eumeta japonica]|uniref:Uncharacterized protein n=1 Tax=Eumeta variegata TaxID=151549 RepID=A0A4C1YWN6_EUMVA|nr:hypothetical protein EVAR_87329_1 [Eumeta japonica]